MKIRASRSLLIDGISMKAAAASSAHTHKSNTAIFFTSNPSICFLCRRPRPGARPYFYATPNFEYKWVRNNHHADLNYLIIIFWLTVINFKLCITKIFLNSRLIMFNSRLVWGLADTKCRNVVKTRFDYAKWKRQKGRHCKNRPHIVIITTASSLTT